MSDSIEIGKFSIEVDAYEDEEGRGWIPYVIIGTACAEGYKTMYVSVEKLENLIEKFTKECHDPN